MGRSERFREAFDYLQKKGIIHNKSQLGEIMNYTRSVVSNAYNGKEFYANEKFLAKFCQAFPNVFNYEWLISGEGEMLQAAELPQEATKIVEVDNGKDEIIKSLLSQNTALVSTINRLADEMAGIKEEIKRLRIDTSIHTYSVSSDDVRTTINDKKEAY